MPSDRMAPIHPDAASEIADIAAAEIADELEDATADDILVTRIDAPNKVRYRIKADE